MRARIKRDFVLHDESALWFKPRWVFQAAWSPAMTSPRRLRVWHPDEDGRWIDIPASGAEVLSEDS